MASLLYANAIEYIFTYLTFRELNRTSQVCQQWLNAVLTMKRFELSVDIFDMDTYNELCMSRMNRHVSKVVAYDEFDDDGRWDNSRMLKFFDRSNLTRNNNHFTSLRSLAVDFNASGGQSKTRINLPPTLTALNITISHLTKSPKSIRLIIEAISRLKELTHLELRIQDENWSPMTEVVETSFAPLIQAPKLHHFILSPRGSSLSHKNMEEIFSMPHLRYLFIVFFDLGSRLKYVLPRTGLVLEDIGNFLRLDTDGKMNLIQLIPSLTSLKCELGKTAPFLNHLPNLKTINIQRNEKYDGLNEDRERILNRDCLTTDLYLYLYQGLTTIVLEEVNVSDEYMHNLMKRLPLLEILHIIRVYGLTSLEFLSSASHTLVDFKFHALRRYDNVELDRTKIDPIYVKSISKLKCLNMWPETDEIAQDLYDMFSQSMPQLTILNRIGDQLPAQGRAANIYDSIYRPPKNGGRLLKTPKHKNNKNKIKSRS